MVKTSTPAAARHDNPQRVLIDVSALREVEHTDDIVDYTLRCIAAVSAGVDASVLDAAEQQVREQFGGERVYVGKRRGQGLVERNAEIRRLYARGERVAFIARKFGLSRFRVHAILNLPAD